MVSFVFCRSRHAEIYNYLRRTAGCPRVAKARVAKQTTIPVAFQFAAVAEFCSLRTRIFAFAGIVVSLVQYLAYGVLSLRDPQRGSVETRQDQRPRNQG